MKWLIASAALHRSVDGLRSLDFERDLDHQCRAASGETLDLHVALERRAPRRGPEADES